MIGTLHAPRSERQGNGDSESCIALDKPQRIALRQRIGRDPC